MEEKNLNAAESIELIGRMIENTRQRLEHDAGVPFLIWGYATLAATVAVAVALHLTADPRWNGLWFLIPVAGCTGMYITQKRRPDPHVRTFVDRVVGQIWTVFGIAAWMVVLPAILTPAHNTPILSLVLLMMGMGSALTGLVIRFRALTAGGFLAMFLSLVTGRMNLLLAACGLPLAPLADMALFGIGFAAMMVLPGHLLNRRAARQKDRQR